MIMTDNKRQFMIIYIRRKRVDNFWTNKLPTRAKSIMANSYINSNFIKPLNANIIASSTIKLISFY